MEEKPIIQPLQKLPKSKKTKDWAKKNLLYWEQVLFNDELNERKINMYRNDNLFNRGVLSREEVMKICNPYNIKDMVLPSDFRHYPIGFPRVQTLLGEQLNRLFNWKVFVTNRDAISEKENSKKDLFIEFVKEQIKAESFDEKEAADKFKGFESYLNYDYQDIKEKSCNELLHHYYLYLDLPTIFARAWQNFLLYGEAVISVDNISGIPTVVNKDPKTLYWAKTKEFPYIDDAEGVIEEVYWPMGQVIDYYYEELTDEDIKTLQEKRTELTARTWTLDQQWSKTDKGVIVPDSATTDLFINTEYPSYRNFQGYYDNKGNVRVVHCRWKSLKKIGKLIEPDGSPIWVSEEYIKQPEDNITWYWITEAWECTRIGDDIYVKAKARDIQYRKLDNKSYCSLGYIGTYIDRALYDIIKEYEIKYDAYMYRTEQAMIKSLGKIGILDLAMIPDGWDVDMWMYYATTLGWAVHDSFKEGKKGQAQGKLAGTMQSRGDSINLEQGQFIQQNMLMLQYIEQQLDMVCGIPPARRGAMSTDSGLGVTQEAKQASANITESYYTLLDNIKVRTLERLLESAKFSLRNKTESIQYVTSELTSKIFEVDGDLVNEAEYGIKIGNAKQDAQAIDAVRRAFEMSMQTGEVDALQLMDIFSNDSAAEIRRKIEKSVNEKRKAAQEAAQAELQDKENERNTNIQLKQLEIADKEKDRELKKYEIDTQNQTKIEVAAINSLRGVEGPSDMNENMIPDPIEQAALALEHQQVAQDIFDKEKDRQLVKKQHDDKIKLEKEKLTSKEKIEKLKAETALKVAKQNKNKYDKAKKK